MNVDSLPRTLMVATVVALLCSGLVATAVTMLRPIQYAQTQLERNRAIVTAAGMPGATQATNQAVIGEFLDLDARVIDLDSGQTVANVDAYSFDHWQSISDTPSDTTAGANGPATSKRVPIYIVRRDGRLTRVVLPIDGPGMWSSMQAYVALESDLVTIADLIIFRHGETPGIGDRIEDPTWLARWHGKKIYDDTGAARIGVNRNAAGPYQVDLISGASITSEALGNAVRRWFEDDRYEPALQQLREQESLP